MCHAFLRPASASARPCLQKLLASSWPTSSSLPLLALALEAIFGPGPAETSWPHSAFEPAVSQKTAGKTQLSTCQAQSHKAAVVTKTSRFYDTQPHFGFHPLSVAMRYNMHLAGSARTSRGGLPGHATTQATQRPRSLLQTSNPTYT